MKNHTYKRRILITGIGGPAGKATTHYFKNISTENNFILGTDMLNIKAEVDKFKLVLPANNPGYIDELCDLIKEFNITLVIPTVTEELYIIADAKVEIEKLNCSVFISNPESTQIVNDKYLTAIQLSEKGILCPKTLLQEQINSLNEISEILSFPFLSKPRFGRGGRGVVIYKDYNSLKSEKRSGLVFQEYIPGQEYNGNIFSYPRGVCLVNKCLRKTALKDGIVGNALSVKPENNEKVEGISKEVSRSLNLEGPADIDIRLNSNGEPVILEVNGRIGANVLSAPEILSKLETLYSEFLGG